MELGGGMVEGICKASVNKIWKRNGTHRELITEKKRGRKKKSEKVMADE